MTQAVKLVGLNAYDGEISEVTTPKRGKLGKVVLIDDDVPASVVTTRLATTTCASTGRTNPTSLSACLLWLRCEAGPCAVLQD